MLHRNQTREPRRLMGAGLLGLLFSVIVVSTAEEGHAQTAEGTVITNTATASWTDANSNAYTAVNASANVTVAFQAGLDAIAVAASVTPASPSTNDTIHFRVANIGNGTDSISVSEAISNGSVMTVTGYRYGGTTYGSLAALNTALAAVAMATTDTVDIAIVYDVPSGQGGQSTDYTLTATSRRDGGTSDNAVTSVLPPGTI